MSASTRSSAGRAAERRAALVVRRALPTDKFPLQFFFDTALRNDYFLRRGQLADILRSRFHEVYVAELDAVLVGVVITTRGARLVNALVHPAYRGLGIGRALVQQAGVTEVRAKLDMSTGDPRGFYRALGFVSTGRRNAKGNIELMQRRGVRRSTRPGPRAADRTCGSARAVLSRPVAKTPEVH